MDRPSFLDNFDLRALEAETTTLVALDASGVIAWTNPAWTRFALDNGGDDVPARFGIGASYFAGIGGELRGFFEEALAECLVTAKPFQLDYECSAPDLYRLHHLRALPFATEGLLLEHSRLVERPHDREAAPAVEAGYRDRHGILRQCGNCRRTRALDGSWNWVPAWVAHSPPRTSHGICEVCIGYYWPDQANRRRKSVTA